MDINNPLNSNIFYVLILLMLSCDTSNDQNIGTLSIPMDAQILINDGQHRRAAIEEAIKENPELRYRIGLAGYETLEKEFRVDHVADVLLEKLRVIRA